MREFLTTFAFGLATVVATLTILTLIVLIIMSNSPIVKGLLTIFMACWFVFAIGQVAKEIYYLFKEEGNGKS